MNEQEKQALNKIKNWRGEYGMPAEYIDWVTPTKLIAAGLITQESPGPGWGLYLVAVGK